MGWSRVPLFRGGAEGYTAVETFVLLEGDTWVALHPGDIPDSFTTTQPATPSETQEGEMLPQTRVNGMKLDRSGLPYTPGEHTWQPCFFHSAGPTFLHAGR